MKFSNRSGMTSPVLLAIIAIFISGCASAPKQPAQPHNFARWEKEISAYEQSDATNPPPKGAIVFTGSSTIRLWKTLAADFPGHDVVNRGFGGSEIIDAAHFADRIVVPYQPSMVVLRAGGNDLWAGKTPEQVFADFKVFVKTVHAKLPWTKIAYISWSPSIARWSQARKEQALNEMVKKYIRGKPRLIYVETYALPLGPDGKPRPELFVQDKLHFSAEGYKLLAARVRSELHL
jgi:lysophospholipase L1-like esterase